VRPFTSASGFRQLQEGDPFHLYLLVSEIRASIQAGGDQAPRE